MADLHQQQQLLASPSSEEDIVYLWKKSLVASFENLFLILNCKEQVMPYIDYAIMHVSKNNIMSLSQPRLEQAFRHVNTIIGTDGPRIAKILQEQSPENQVMLGQVEKRPKLTVKEHRLPLTPSPQDIDISRKMANFVHQKTLQNTMLNEREFIESSESTDMCYRLNAAHVNRSVQMKQDYVENLDGPLARTTLHLLKIIQEKQKPKPWYLKDPTGGASATDNANVENSSKNSFLASDLLQQRLDPYKIQKSSQGTKWVHPVIEERLANLEAFLVTPQQATSSSSSRLGYFLIIFLF